MKKEEICPDCGRPYSEDSKTNCTRIHGKIYIDTSRAFGFIPFNIAWYGIGDNSDGAIMYCWNCKHVIGDWSMHRNENPEHRTVVLPEEAFIDGRPIREWVEENIVKPLKEVHRIVNKEMGIRVYHRNLSHILQLCKEMEEEYKE